LTWRISIYGLVQGVGFRPFLQRLAVAEGLVGYAQNVPAGIEIEVNGSEKQIRAFLQKILREAPPLAEIHHSKLIPIITKTFEGFHVKASGKKGNPRLSLPPDLAPCKDCLSELLEPGNKRFRYPFISCTNCGPRVSIARNIPFDRNQTTMSSFPLCDSCRNEYENPADRRFYAQTISCADCGVSLLIQHNDQCRVADAEEVIEKIITAWQDGKVVAIKGVGGFLLTADAACAEAINTIRIRKKRPLKPFALMYPTIQHLNKHFSLQASEKEAL
jgi:hydrogenase maturation protein HypF